MNTDSVAFKTGDKVLLRGDSKWANGKKNNPMGTGGTIRNTDGACLPIVVDWDNGEWNTYNAEDLKHFTETNKKQEKGMTLIELLEHVTENVKAGKAAGHGLLYDSGEEEEEEVDEIIFSNHDRYSKAPKTHVVNGFTVPAPESVEPPHDCVYYYPDYAEVSGIGADRWTEHAQDFLIFNRKQVFLTKDAAIANQKAQCFIDPFK